MTPSQLLNDRTSFKHPWETPMNAPQKTLIGSDTELQLQTALQAQRDSYLAEGEVSAATRIDRIDRAISVLVKHS